MFFNTLEKLNPNLILIDATGVIYNETGPIKNIDKVISKIQENFPTFLATNNAFQDPKSIAEKLRNINIQINENQIFSSGLGLKYNSKINSLIKNKECYVFGSDNSHFYIKFAGGNCTSDINQSDVIVLTSSLHDEEINKSEYNKILNHLKNNKSKKFICCNPDQFIPYKSSKKPVAGYYMTLLEQDLNRKGIWFGKPFKNYSDMINLLLKEFNLKLNTNSIFFDDNINNVSAFQKHFKLKGVCVTETGLYKLLYPKKTSSKNILYIKKLHLDEPLTNKI